MKISARQGWIATACRGVMHCVYCLSHCNHEVLVVEHSPAAEIAGFVRASAPQLAAAARLGRVKDSKQSATQIASTFPAPLILPNDDLYLDPNYPPQSLRPWQRQKDFSTLTETCNKIYVAGPPTVSGEASYISKWSCPNPKVTRSRMERPNTTDVSQYLQVFYHGLDVVMLTESTFTFAAWDESGSEPAGSIALNTTVESTRVRTRAECDQIFARQLNLDDLIDVAISCLPEDACALILLIDQDIYENDEDEFTCGRAYGGDHVCVISSARYHPALDEIQEVERSHAWPASHCESFVRESCKELGALPSEHAYRTEMTGSIHSALLHHPKPPPKSNAFLRQLWLFRVCRTASHELGHCFGIDHCVYYACIMQGTASLAEDSRQPPFLCPVDTAKLLKLTKTSEKERERALLSFCCRYQAEAWRRVYSVRGMVERANRAAGERSITNPVVVDCMISLGHDHLKIFRIAHKLCVDLEGRGEEVAHSFADLANKVIPTRDLTKHFKLVTVFELCMSFD